MSEHDDSVPDFESGGVDELELKDVPTELGILPLRDTLLFPQAILPLAVARESSVALVNDAVKDRKVIGHVTYEQLRNGEIQVEGQAVQVGSLSSYRGALEVAHLLADEIRRGDFLVTEAISRLPTNAAMKSLEIRQRSA